LLQGALYVLLFLICVAVFAKTRSRNVRQSVLLISSYALYLTWSRWFVFVLLASTVMNFLIGRWLRKDASPAVLTIGILLNLALLVVFKYLPEAALSIPLSSLERFSHLALPLGLSFWTFQAMSYLFDQYRGEELEPSFFEFALYMVLFPVTISGPVCRLPDMLPQFRCEETTSWGDITLGFRRIAVGVLMVQLAKLLGQGVLAGDGISSGFDRVERWSGPDVWCLAFGYGLQLFFDFAGYSHMAIGGARAFGITVPENFDRPFASTTPSVFWTRWHVSLSFWIRDYVFFPLAVLRREVWWRNLALVISMVLFGLWHKASVLFLLWGLYHGVLLVLHRRVQQLERNFNWEPPGRLWTSISWLTTVSLVNLGWIFFRSPSLSKTRQMVNALLSPASYSASFLTGSLYFLIAALAVGYALAAFVGEMLNRHLEEAQSTQAKPTGVIDALARYRWFWLPPLYAIALICVLVVTLSRGTSAAQFMYGNF
jgi:alginate O-acetyltransferase complex protein AlgI